MAKDPRQSRLEGIAHSESQLEKSAKSGSAANRDFFTACQQAKSWTGQAGLLPEIDEDGEDRYTARQGVKAACHGREDAAATLILQKSILERLDRNRVLLWACIVLLAYIAVRVT